MTRKEREKVNTMATKKSNNGIMLYTLKAVKEKEFIYNNVTIESKNDIIGFLESIGLQENTEEVVALVCLNAKGKIIGFHEVSRGTLSSSQVHPREVYKRAIVNNASSIIVAHNHPSGYSNPSNDDIEVTKRLVECGKLLGIKLLDHIIIGEDEHTSLMAMGYIK